MRVTSRRPRLSALRTRTAVLAAGLGASTVLGAGAAFAAETGVQAAPAAASTSSAVAAQAKAQAAKAAAVTAKPVAAPKALSASGWSKPVSQYVVSATYGKGGAMWASNHSGQDFAVPTGTPVKSVGPGTVVKAGPNGAGDGPAYGNAVVVKHDNDTYSQYAHLSRVDVKIGQQVKGGQQIALSGNTGNSSGPHLHFEIRTTPNYGSAINPVTHLRSEGITI
ncbi:M23 family metallopeptidase [Streptomyces inusitatus]|uniref:M23 family metallopeptidase n=1 Tax=Streptomyces inusitatus TaxID=68221 RepID=UPI00167EA56E|nr:M23 family metallopeptidase [Streptomyces inusitatus]